MFKRLSLAAMVAAIAAMGASDAHAQRDAARLGIQKPYYGSGGGGSRSAGRSYSYGGGATPTLARPAPAYSQPSYNVVPQQPAIASDPGYRTFSIEPLGINPRDTVVVSRNSPLMLGADVVGTLPQGIQFQVSKVRNGWLGAVVNVNGQELRGWVWGGNVQRLDDAAPVPPAGS